MRGTTRRIAIVAGIIVALGAVAVVAYMAGRSQTVAPPAARPSTSGATTPHAATDPSSSQPAGIARGDVTAGSGGQVEGPSGLPLGYSHDEDGAVAAATNYLMWMNSIKITDKQAADAMAAAVAIDDATETLFVRTFDETRSGFEGLTEDQLQPARGAYAIANFDGDHATVYVWAPEVITDVNGVTEHLWAIDAVRVVWADGDWKLDGDLIARTGGAAVDPSDPAGNPTAAEKHSILSRTPADPGEITDSAEQTWLEYANAPR